MVEGYMNTEIGVIPSDWSILTIGEEFIFKNGLNKEKKYFGSGTPIVNYMDVYKHTGISVNDIKGKVTLTNQEIKNYEVLKGDVLFTRTSETVEEIGISSVIVDELINTVFSGFVLRGRPINKILEIEFCRYCFSSSIVRKQILTTASYTTRALTNGRLLSDIKIPLPPTKAEQTAIAIALSDADTLITELSKLISKKKAVKYGILHEILKPKEDWSWTSVEKLGSPYGGLSGKSKADFKDGNCPYIPFMNIMSNPIIDKNYLNYVRIGAAENQNRALKGDLFFNGSSETPEEVGMCSILLNDIPNLYLNSFCFGFRLYKEEKTDGLYLTYFFRSSYGRRLLYILAQGATRHNLSKSNFMKIEFQIPNPDEQIRISGILRDIDNDIFELENKLVKQKMLKQGMMQVLLTGKIRLI